MERRTTVRIHSGEKPTSEPTSVAGRPSATSRTASQRKLARLREAYLEGELDRGEYQARKRSAAEELAALPEPGDADEAAGTHLLNFLRDVASAWAAANDWERNKLARQLFATVVASGQTVVAVVPRPGLEPYFDKIPRPVNQGGEGCTGGKRRGSVRHVQNLAARRVPVPNIFVGAGASRRQLSCETPGDSLPRCLPTRARKLTPEQEAEIRAFGKTRSLRALAAEFGVSHETVRSALRRR